MFQWLVSASGASLPRWSPLLTLLTDGEALGSDDVPIIQTG